MSPSRANTPLRAFCCKLTTPAIFAGRSLSVLPVSSVPNLPTERAVAPDTFPVIDRLSLAPVTKLTSSVTVPPPTKLPVRLRESVASESSPMSSVPFAFTCSVPALSVLAPEPKAITDPPPILIVSHPVTFAPATVPEAFLKCSVLAVPVPPSRAVAATLLPLSKVRSFESAASAILPVSDAPLSTTTVSQPFSPCVCTSECSAPAPPVNLSVSVPAPPLISEASENVPPAKVSASFPPPRSIFPVTLAPAATVTAALPAPPRMALRPEEPTSAPLLSATITELPLWTLVLIAAAAAPEPPMTSSDTAMVVVPAALRVTSIPRPAVPVPRTGPDASMETAPVPLEATLIPACPPVTVAAVIVIAPPALSSLASIPAAAVEATLPVTLIEIAPPPWLSATIAPCCAVIALPVADWVKMTPPVPPVCVKLKAVPAETATGVSEFRVTERLVAPDADNVCVCAIWVAPLQVNAPFDPLQLLVLVKLSRLNVLAVSSNRSR